MEFSNIKTLKQYPRNRKLKFLLVVIDHFYVRDGYVYGRFQDRSGSIDGNIEWELYAAHTQYFKSGLIILLSNVNNEMSLLL